MNSIARRIVNRPAATLAAAYLLFAAIQPRGGFSWLDICLFHRSTGVPCPTCGMTRAVTNLFVPDPGAAMRWHPGVLLIFPSLVFLVMLMFVSDDRYRRASELFDPRRRLIFRTGFAVAALFLVFGAARAAAVFLHWTTFPFP
ncbi:MAG: DUF2752 domain-containing protein [Planctomycetes bacterium]|nr:DUF2752 domain-containing protein [Planctomycetota bacterium]